MVICFFFVCFCDDPTPTEIYTRLFGRRVRCVYDTGDKTRLPLIGRFGGGGGGEREEERERERSINTKAAKAHAHVHKRSRCWALMAMLTCYMHGFLNEILRLMSYLHGFLKDTSQNPCKSQHMLASRS